MSEHPSLSPSKAENCEPSIGATIPDRKMQNNERHEDKSPTLSESFDEGYSCYR